MTGPEHYQKAEELLSYAVGLDKHDEDVPLTLAEAQVHATLALAAATALNDNDGGSPVGDYRAWKVVASAVTD